MIFLDLRRQILQGCKLPSCKKVTLEILLPRQECHRLLHPCLLLSLLKLGPLLYSQIEFECSLSDLKDSSVAVQIALRGMEYHDNGKVNYPRPHLKA
jgi:hypothetical protein